MKLSSTKRHFAPTTIIVTTIVIFSSSSLLLTTFVDSAAVLATPVVAQGCEWRGKSYAEGEDFDPDPCTSCHCEGGLARCAMMACRMPACVDSVRLPDQCCPSCPNGENCRAPDGTIIPANQTVTLKNGAICNCGRSHFFTSSDALCQIAVS